MGLNWYIPKPGEEQNVRITIAKPRKDPGSGPYLHYQFKMKRWPFGCEPTPLGVALARRRRQAFWRR